MDDDTRRGCLAFLPLKLALPLADIVDERDAQIHKWGEQHNSDGTGSHTFVAEAKFRRDRCEAAFSAGKGTWKDILLEEVWEAMAERNPAKLRAELIQVAAVAVSWVEDLDSRQ